MLSVDCAKAGPTAKGATRAVEARSCVTSTRLKRPRAAAEIADVRLVGFAALEVFIFVPLYHYISVPGRAAISGNDALDRTSAGICKDIGPPMHPTHATTRAVGEEEGPQAT
jgi:hypothetical protein